MNTLIESLKRDWHFWVAIALLSVLIVSLMGQLRVARANEGEMSRRLYQAIRMGYTVNTNTPHAN